MDLNLTRSAYTGKRGEGVQGALGLALFINFFRNLFFSKKLNTSHLVCVKKRMGGLKYGMV